MKIFTQNSIQTPIQNQSFSLSDLSSSSIASSKMPSSLRSAMRKLRAMDSSIHALPPICTVDFRNPSIRIQQAELQTQFASHNAFYKQSWILSTPGFSNLRVATEITKNPTRSYSLDLVHLSSLVNGEPQSKITITVNGKVIKSDYNPNNGNYFKDSFDITPYIVDGKNEVSISLDPSARSNYWIQSLAIQAK